MICTAITSPSHGCFALKSGYEKPESLQPSRWKRGASVVVIKAAGVNHFVCFTDQDSLMSHPRRTVINFARKKIKIPELSVMSAHDLRVELTDGFT